MNLPVRWLVFVLIPIHVLVGTYYTAIFGKSISWAYCTNFIIPALPYLLLGEEAWVRKKDLYKIDINKIIVYDIAFFILSMGESFFINNFTKEPQENIYIFSLGSILCTFILCINLSKLNCNSIVLQKLADCGKKYSTGIYIIHVIVGTIVSKVFLENDLLNILWSTIGAIVVFVTSLVIVYILEKI
jgi:peptidoglycan/LPS O-acetylase OafA/YrhL